MNFIENIKERARKNKKKIILPESTDERIINAAKVCVEENVADIILIGKPEEIKKFNVELNNIEIIDPSTSEMTEGLINQLYELRKEKGMTLEQARNLLLNDYMYYACMLVKNDYADGIVSGACHSTADTLRPALQIIKTKAGAKLVSAFFIMIVPNCEYGSNGVFLFGDTALEPNPDSEKLAAIAASSCESFEYLIGEKPIAAMLSFSTTGSASHPDVTKVQEAVKIAKREYSNYQIDGEFQLDAAIMPKVARKKCPENELAGKANVLIFPTLDAGNIGYKLVHRLAKAEAYGPITQGMRKPVNDLSRGCNVSEIVGVVAITAVQANEKNIS